MKKNKLRVLLLLLFIAFIPTFSYAQPLTLDKLLEELTNPQITSLQKLERVDLYKGEAVKGAGRIKDILKSFASEGKAELYVETSFRGKQYEIVLEASLDVVRNIEKGQKIYFRGKFAGITFETLRFEDVQLIKKAWWAL